MTWQQFFTSSIGKKLVMGITGLFLTSFLLIHCIINAMIFFNDGGLQFNEWGDFMGSNVIIRTMEIVLFVGFILHIVQGLMLWSQNRSKRPVDYLVKPGNATSKWYSRSMTLLGTLVLIFLILHLYHFWWPSRFGATGLAKQLNPVDLSNGKEGHNLFEEMKFVFSNLWVVVVYCLGVASLCYHLIHGFQSAFQTFGLNHKRYTPLINSIGVGYAVVICIVFALMPIALYLKWIE